MSGIVNQDEVIVGNPTRATDMNTAIENIAELALEVDSSNMFAGGIPIIKNPSFESDVDSDNVPDGWDFVPDSGGAGTIDTGGLADGKYSFKITYPGGGGNGGGYLEYPKGANAFINVNNLQSYFLRWIMKSSLVTVSNKVQFRWYDKDGSFISASDIWSDSTLNPLEICIRGGKVLAASVPSTARFMKIRLIGGVTGSAAGITYYDGVQFFNPCFRNEKLWITGTTNWTVPDGITQIEVEITAGGGGGGDKTGNGGGGGGGGAYNKIKISVNPGEVYTFGIGGGGAAGTAAGAGANGSPSIIQFRGVTLYTVPGGVGGAGGASGTGGAGGGALAGDNSAIIAAQNGGAGGNHAGGTGGVAGSATIGTTSSGSSIGYGGKGASFGGAAADAGHNGEIVISW